jgi:hypothetical protein
MKSFTRVTTSAQALERAAISVKHQPDKPIAIVPLSGGGYLVASGYGDLAALAGPIETVTTDPDYTGAAAPSGPTE